MLLLCFILALYSAAAPHGPVLTSTDTSKASSPYSCSPNTRTEWSLVYSCLAIIFSCTWTAIHPNIPDPKDSKWTILFRKIKICLIAIIAPEWVVMWAVRQFLFARKFRNMYNQVAGNTGKQDRSCRIDHDSNAFAQKNGHLPMDSSW
jgi:hypothetical protein